MSTPPLNEFMVRTVIRTEKRRHIDHTLGKEIAK